MSERLWIVVDGERVEAARGATVAAVLLDAGVTAFRRSPTGAARAPLCGMGVCFECRVTIDGEAHQRACMRLVEPEMQILTSTAT